MAAPNLKNPTTVTGKTISHEVTTGFTSVLANSAASGKVLKINSVYCTNFDATAIDIFLTIYDGTMDYELIMASVQGSATQVLINRDAYIYLEENRSLRVVGSANNNSVLMVSYEEIS